MRLVAGMPFISARIGVIETSHAPGFFRRILHVATRFFAFVLVLIAHDPSVVGVARAPSSLVD